MAVRTTVEAFTRANDPRYQPSLKGRVTKVRQTNTALYPENRNRART